jgi:hypothetical protein
MFGDYKKPVGRMSINKAAQHIIEILTLPPNSKVTVFKLDLAAHAAMC